MRCSGNIQVFEKVPKVEETPIMFILALHGPLKVVCVSRSSAHWEHAFPFSQMC